MFKHCIAAGAIFISLTFPGYAKQNQFTQPVLLHADQITYDQEKNLLIAVGNVQVYQEKEALQADSLTYDRNLDKITATGNIVWQRESKDVFFGSYAEMQDRLKNGLIKEFRALLSDESRLAASRGIRRGGIETQMESAVYSPCRICRQNPDQAPLWQIKSETVLWDEEAQDIIYTDAWMEFFGVPVLYTPYMRHPDPSVKQRSGFLAPMINSSKDLGFYAGIPYYYVFSPDKDITIMPLFTTKKGQFLSGEYRQRLSTAVLNIAGSYGYSERLARVREMVNGRPRFVQREVKKPRGHIDSTLKWDVTDHWRFKAHALRATDATYMRQFPFYGYINDNVLTSKASAEGFYGLNYARMQGILYQGLRRTDMQKTIPKIGPDIDFNYVSNEQAWNSRFYVDANGLIVSRGRGTNMQRMSTTGTWKVPFATNLGDKYELSLRLRGDGYSYSDYRRPSAIRDSDSSRGRVFPQAFLEWEYPWIKPLESGHVIISPVASLIVAPQLGSQNKIPNEDCDYIEPNDEYLMNYTRLPGLDRIDDGSRFNYGLKTDTVVSADVKGGAFIGQTASFSKPDSIFRGTGFDKRPSDLFGRITVNLYKYVDLRYRFRLDRSNLSPTRNELHAGVGIPEFRVTADYLKLPPNAADPQAQAGNQISLGVSSAFTKNWSTAFNTVQELGSNSRPLQYLLNLTYNNECISSTLQLQKTYYRDRDIQPGYGFMLIIAFKTLGGQTLQKIRFKQDLSGLGTNGQNNGIFGDVL